MSKSALGAWLWFLAGSSSLFAQLVITSPQNLQRGVEGIAYSNVLTASGGIPPYTWTLALVNPAAPITLAPNGTLSFPAPTAGTFGVRVTVADSMSQSQTGDLFLVINSTLVVEPAFLPDGTRGVAYPSGISLSSFGGQTPVTWSVAAGTFPPGLTLSPNGTIAGTPTASGTFNFTAQVADSGTGPANQVKTQALSITIFDPLAITTNSPLPNGVVNTAYSQTLTATGIRSPYPSWSISAGALPAGLTINSLSGTISGTPTAVGTSNFTVQLQDSNEVTQTVTKAFTLTITSGFDITTATPLPNGTVNSSYSQTLAATGGTPPYSNWQVISGSLPAGLTLNASTGLISGNPTAAGTSNFTVQVRDSTASVQQTATKAFALTINPAPLTITTNSPLPNGTGGAVYGPLTFAATGGTTPYSNWILISGALPSGLSLNASTGVLSGTPLQTGPFAFTVQVQDAATTVQIASKSFTLTIDAVPFTITTASPLPGGTVGSAYSQTFAAAGGIPPYTNWAVVGGTLPQGLTLNPLTGVLSGTPTVDGTFSLTVQVRDSTASAPQITSKVFALTIAAQPTTITILTPLPSGTINQAYSQMLEAKGGTPPYTWSIASGSLPPGLNLSPQGLVSGNPTQTGTSTFTIRVIDSMSGSDQRVYSLTVNPTPLIITTSSVPNGRIVTPYTQTFAVTGGTGPYIWSLPSGVLPNGLSVSPGGVLSGTPTEIGTFRINIGVADSTGLLAFKPFDLVIDAADPTIVTTSPLPVAFANVPYMIGFTAVGGTQPFVWTIPSGGGSLPPGITLAPTGVLSGTAPAAGSFSFPVQLVDANQRTATQVFTLFVDATPPTITTISPLPTATLGTAYSQTLSVSGGFPPYSWALDETSTAPPGLTFSNNGVLSGTPTQAGTFSFTVLVTDGHGSVATKLLAVTVSARPTLTISTASLPNGAVNTFYSQSLLATGGSPPYSWDLASGTLPPGLTITPLGAIQGAPTTVGTFNFVARVNDSNQGSATRALSITIATASPGFIITTPDPLPAARINTPYTQLFTATGGFGPITWQVVSGALPNGLNLSVNGLLSGTPTQAGTFTFTVRARDTDVPSFAASTSETPTASPEAAQTTDKTFTLIVESGLVVTTSFLPTAQALVPYSTTLTAAGGIPPYTWSLASGTMLPGFALTTNGEIVGTGAQADAGAFTVRVTDRTGAVALRGLVLIVAVPGQPAPGGLEIATQSLPDAVVGKLYGMMLTARNGSPPYTWGFSGLPAGLVGNRDGEIIGTPEASGTFSVRVTVADTGRGQASSVFNFVVQPGQVIITTPRVPDGRVDETYSTAFAATGGIAPYTFAIIGGALPGGLSLAPNGTLSGTPGTPGTYQFTVQATDSTNQKGSKSFGILIRPAVLRITTVSLGNGVVGVAYSAGLAAAGGTPSYRWSASGLPDGLSIDSNTGGISGTPTRNGTFSVSATVTDADGQTASKSFPVEITVQLTITTPSVGNMVTGTPVSVTLAATGGLPPYSWSIIAGSLPPGVTLSPEGTITGTPTALGTFNFTVQARDTNGVTGSRAYPVRVVDPLVITTQTVPAAPFSAAYSTSLAATGGTAPYSWSLATGSLPPGLSLSPAGAISGTATQGGTFNFTARATDAGTPQLTADKALSIQVSLPDVTGLTITVPQNPQPAQQVTTGVSIGAAYPLEITGTLSLSFAPNAANNADDPAIQFSTGGRSVPFRIPAGQTQAVFSVASLAIQTGTTAGTITLTTNLTGNGSPIGCNCPLTQTIVIARSAPVITALRVARTATGFNVTIVGFSTTREVTQGTFRFAGTGTLQTTELTVQLGPTFTAYFQSAAATFGGQFSVTVPFTIQGGTATVNSVTATLTNAVGTSQPSTASF